MFFDARAGRVNAFANCKNEKEISKMEAIMHCKNVKDISKIDVKSIVLMRYATKFFLVKSEK
jgi:hypothetical protein